MPSEVLRYDMALTESTEHVVSALTDLETGIRTNEEIVEAKQAIGHFGTALQGYTEERLGELVADGADGQDLGQMMEEIAAKVELLHGSVLGSAGSVSETRRTLETIRVDTQARWIARAAIGATAGIAVWAASRGFDIGMDRVSTMAQDVSAWTAARGISPGIGDSVSYLAPAALLGSSTARKGGANIAKKLLGRASESIIDQDDESRIEFIDAHERSIGRELSDQEKLDVSYWLEASEDTRTLRQEMKLFVAERFIAGKGYESDQDHQEIAIALTGMALNHITKLYGLDTERSLGVSSAVRDAAADTVGKVAGNNDISKELAKAVIAGR